MGALRVEPKPYRFIFEFDLADRLRKSLRARDIGVQEIAADAGVSRNTVGNWLSGRSTPSREQLVVWAAYTACPLSWLLTGEAPKPPAE